MEATKSGMVPSRMDGMERQIPRYRAPLLEGRPRRRGGDYWPRRLAGLRSDLFDKRARKP